MQARTPAIAVGLSRVGVTGVEKVVRIREELFLARFDCYVDLSAVQKGAHMSRFEEVVNAAIGEVVLSEAPFRAETLAQDIAELVRERQGAARAEVIVAARYPENKPAPVSGVQTQEIYTLHGRALAFAHGTRRLVGVSATGMTACPCAQELIAAPRPRAARRRAHPRADRRRAADRADGHPQPARPGDAPHRLPGGLRDRDRGLHPAGDRRVEHVLGDLRADEALRRGRGGGKGPSPPPLRRGLRTRDDRGRRRPLRGARRRQLRAGPPGEPRDDPPAQRGGRAQRAAERAARGDRLGLAGSPTRPASRSGWTGAPSLSRRPEPLPAASAGAGRRRSPAPRAPSPARSRTAAPTPTGVCPGPR